MSSLGFSLIISSVLDRTPLYESETRHSWNMLTADNSMDNCLDISSVPIRDGGASVGVAAEADDCTCSTLPNA